MEITITMKTGRPMKVEATAHVYNDSDGAGAKWVQCDDLTCYWPGKGKRRAIPDDLYDTDKAAESYIAAEEGRADDARTEYLISRHEARMERCL